MLRRHSLLNLRSVDPEDGSFYRSQGQIAPLPNGHVALLVSMSKSLGLSSDMIFGTDLFRHYKPDPETYLGAAAFRMRPCLPRRYVGVVVIK
jgi:hypothetical protein